MHENGGRCATKISFGANFTFDIYINDLTENVQGAKLVLFIYDTNLLITRKDDFVPQHKIMNIMRETVQIISGVSNGT
jgi:hypothetical protein